MRRAVHSRITTTDVGEEGPRYVVSNTASATSFLADQQTVDFIEAVDRLGDPGLAAQALRLDKTMAEQLLAQLVASGVLVEPGVSVEPPKQKKPAETRLMFFRIELLDIGPMVRAFSPVLRLPFTRLGFVVWFCLLLLAVSALTRDPQGISAAIRSLTTLSWEGAAVLAVIFTLLKIVHEFGHATALWLAGRAEGINIRTIRAGVAFFALFPFPFTDATAAWQLHSRYRRAGIAMAGIYLESWIAAIAAIVWGQVTPGETQTILFQMLIVSGVSTLLFNLNPLVRLDGYYVFSDLAGRPNLATRATGAARALGVWMMGGPAKPVSGFHLGYWTLSYAYRWVIFAGIFWITYTIEPLASVPVLGIALISLVLRPLVMTAKAAWSSGIAWWRLGLSTAAAAVLVVAMTVPVPDTLHVHGMLVRFEAEPVRAQQDVQIAALVPERAARSGDVVVHMVSPALDIQLASLNNSREKIEAALRSSRLGQAAQMDALTIDLERLEQEIATARDAVADLSVELQDGQIWEPAVPVAAGTWVAAHQNRMLGQVTREVSPYVRVDLDLRHADFSERLKPGMTIAARGRNDIHCVTELTMDQMPTMGDLASEGLVLRAELPANDPCLADAPAGSEIILRLTRPDAAIAYQLYMAAQRLAQNRLPIDQLEGSK